MENSKPWTKNGTPETTNILVSAINRAEEHFIQETEPCTLYHNLLTDFIRITNSEYGFIGEVLYDSNDKPRLKTHAISKINWNEETQLFYESNAVDRLELRILNSSYKATITSGQAVIVNDLTNDPRYIKPSDNRLSLNSFLGIPVFVGKNLMGMVGVTNGPDGFDESMVITLQPLLKTYGLIIDAYRKNQRHHRVEQSLKNREAEFRAVVDNAVDAIITIDESGIIESVNPAVQRMFGYCAEEVIGKNVNMLMPATHRAKHDKYIQTYIKTAVAKIVGIGREIEAQRKDGSIFPMDLAVSEMQINGQRKFTGIVRDITHLKATEQALRQNTEYFNHLLNSSNDVLWATTPDGSKYLYMSHSAETLYGRPVSDFIENPRLQIELIHPDDQSQVLNSAAILLNTEQVETNYRIVRADGAIRWVHDRKNMIRDSHGNYVEIAGIATDITERKQAQEALQNNEAQLSFLFAESPVVTYNCEAHGDFACTFISENVKKLFGYEPESFLNEPRFWINGIHPDDLQHVFNELELLFKHGYHTHVYRFRKRDGSYCWVEDGLRLIYDNAGIPKEIVGYWANIDERKQAESALIEAKEAAEKANQAKSEFLSSMSHELRTPLNAILGLAQLYEYDNNLQPKHKLNAKEIYKAGEHLLSLINDVLDLAKIEAGHIDLSMERVALRKVLDDCIILTQPLLLSRGILLELDAQQCNDLYVFVDYTRLKQVMLNLMSNAVKYNRQNGKIMINCATGSENSIRISVTDTGQGLTEDKVARLFQPFSRLGAEFSEVEGTGIGLMITKQLVEMMGGNIGVESVPGKGSRFWVELKIASHQQPEDTQEKINTAPESASLSNISRKNIETNRILIAEDNKANQEVLRQQLDILGYQADIASNGQQAWEWWQSNKYDLLLTDIHMPEMNGLQLTDSIRKAETSSYDHTPIIVISANAMDGEAQRCMEAGMDGFIAKPINLNDLQRTLEKWLPKDESESLKDASKEKAMLIQAEKAAIDIETPINFSILSQFIGANPERHRRFLKKFVNLLPENIQKINSAYENQSASDIVFFSHKLKSPAKTMGAHELAAVCQALETTAKASQWETIDSLIPKLNNLAEKIKCYLSDYCDPEPKLCIIDFSNLKVLIIDDDSFMLDLMTLGLNVLGINEIISATSGETALKIIDDVNCAIDVVLCDLNMPGMDGVEFLRYLAERDYSGGIALMSGEDLRILKTAEKLAEAHHLNTLGVLEKPVASPDLVAILGRLKGTPASKTRNNPVVLITEELRYGIDNNELITFFQPKVAIATREVVGVEALVRWQHPEKGMLAPNLFIPLAEENGLIDDLTMVVFEQTMLQSAQWHTNGINLKVSVNISVDSLHKLDWPEFVVDQANKYNVNPANVMLEITESRLMENITTALEVLTRLSLKKIDLSIDDFGTGYSSMEQLQRIPFTELKIDRAFTHGAAQDKSARAILESSIALAKNLNMSIVAEGIETQEDWDLVAKLGCDQAQGFFIAEPMPGDQLESWLNTMEKKQCQT